MTIEKVGLEPFWGRAQVVDVRGRPLIRPEDLGKVDAPRVLLRTDAWTDFTRFPRLSR
jgi:hypothetical protein